MIGRCIEKANKIPYKTAQSRHYAIVVDKKGRILGESSNCYRTTHPIMHKASRKLGLEKDFIHAECRSIIRALKNGEPYKIYVARVAKDGSSVYSAPCPVCSHLIREAGIKVVEYTT